jgi:hypothetical protein
MISQLMRLRTLIEVLISRLLMCRNSVRSMYGLIIRMLRTRLLNPLFRGRGYRFDLAIDPGDLGYGLYRLLKLLGPLAVRLWVLAMEIDVGLRM